MVSDLDARGRVEAARADLRDLGAVMPEAGAPTTAAVAMPAALGWLYVSEGSTLGVAFLFKEARDRLGLSAAFGARNLAAYPEGRAKVWRRFIEALDSERIAPEQHETVIAGANAAYDRFGTLLQMNFVLA
ncbi:MAG: biliverdin-producing heme oxygenase [Pseudomonas sp.]